MLERKEQFLMMWPDLRKEAWSPGGISPGEISCLCKYCTPINLDPRMGEGSRERGHWERRGSGEGKAQGLNLPGYQTLCQAPCM